MKPPILPIWLINLDSNPERYQTASAEIHKSGLTAERFSAINGRDLTKHQVVSCYDAEANKKYFRRPISNGEIGCYLSHRALWQRMVDENIEVAIILEDDFQVEPEFSSAIEKVSELKQWDLIKLADDRAGEGRDKLDIGDGFRIVNFSKIPNCTTAYAVSLPGAKKLLKRTRFFRPVDVDFQFYPELDLRIFSILPYKIRASNQFESEIDKISGGTRKKDTTFFRNLRYRLQLLKVRKTFISGDVQKVFQGK